MANLSDEKSKKHSTSLDVLQQERATKTNAIEIPQISLPKGGGALKGIDEKFQVNAANGTASFSIPLPFSPNRNGFTPQLSLSYNSGTGNSLFGIGWDIGLPAIQRRTDKKLPRYFDTNTFDDIAQEDSFMFSGVEELVPFLNFKTEKWTVAQEEQGNFIIRQYRPRIEGSFSRIERIYKKDQDTYYWCVTSKENITTFFGYSESCRIADPKDGKKVFQWLPEFSFDDKGSWVWYEYKKEDLETVTNELHEKNRFDGIALFSSKHLKFIKYGNEKAKYFDINPYDPTLPQDENYFFTLVFDYGEHDKDAPKLNDNAPWIPRKDAFSSCRSGFEMRTYRLCQRVLMFHTFPNDGENNLLNNGEPTLVRSLDFSYTHSNEEVEEIEDFKKKITACEVTYLSSITQTGYIKTGNTYSKKSLPTMTFDYQKLRWNKKAADITAENLVHAPIGLSNGVQWVDLYNEGISGILTEQANAWFYKSNLGNGAFSNAQLVMPKPSLMGLSNGLLHLQDLEANGEKQLVVNMPQMQGYFELNDQGEWQPFRAFAKNLNLDLRDPKVRMIDIDGDGKPEVLLSEQGAFWWWKNEGKIGYDAPELATKPYDEEHGPSIVFQDQEQRIFLADMSGDGLTDIVRIRNGEVCYWPNMGYGKFGAKVTMGHSPVFDHPDLFNPAYLQLTDISGTGATDIIYLGKNRFTAYLNCSGNAWSKGEAIEPFFPTEQPNKIAVTDLLGNGTACIVWSSELPAYQNAPMRYIDLMGGIKPHIMQRHQNNMGKATEVVYKSSTHYYLEDKKKGENWITKLAFPVQVVAKTILTESVTNVRFTSQYSYHHGYYDHAEREFRGFGRVEQLDTEEFGVFDQTGASNNVSKEHFQPPVLSKTWFHTGASPSLSGRGGVGLQFKQEYWEKGVKEFELPDALLFAADNLGNFNIEKISTEEWREALRACKGMTLRQEVFAVEEYKTFEKGIKEAQQTSESINYFDVFRKISKQNDLVPYSVATHNYEIQLLQTREKNRYGVFMVKESEAITYSYERDADDPRIAHTLTLETDELGNVLQGVSVVYPRQKTEGLLEDVLNDNQAVRNAKKHGRDQQQKMWITLTQNDFTKDLIKPQSYYLRKGWQTKTYELTGIKPANKKFSIAEIKTQLTDLQEIEYQQKADNATPQKRLIEHIKTKFYNADLTAPLPDGQMAARAMAFEAYQLAYTPNLLADIFKPSAFSVDFEVTEADMKAGRFLQDNANWWIQSGTVLHRRTGDNFENIKNRFFAPVGYIDSFDTQSEVFCDAKNLFMQRSVDALDNENQVVNFDYRTLSPTKIKDLNNNLSAVVVDELGLVKAVASEGKDTNNDNIGEEGDTLHDIDDFTDTTEQGLIAQFFAIANVAAPNICSYTNLQNVARQLLGNASARMVYDFSKTPCVVVGIAREQHKNPNSPLQISFEYTDGLGKVAMKKVQAEAGEVTMPDGSALDMPNQLRWVGTGRTVLNNKGNPIKQYEPYFSTTPAYENDPAWVERGVSPTIYYDGTGRNIRTELPNGTFTRVTFNAWKQISYDVNDTVLESDWYKERIILPASDPEFKAAKKTEPHANTPSIIILDTLGRPTLGVDLLNTMVDISSPIAGGGSFTFSEIDIEGNARSVTDARGNVVMSWRNDMLGHRVAQKSMDAGKRWILNNALGNPVKTWDERENEFSFEYDVLHRPIKSFIKDGANKLISLTEYGETHPNPKSSNLRGKVIRQCSGSGQVKTVRYDFKGNVLAIQKQMPQDAKANLLDWTTASLDPTVYTQITEYDALNRMQRLYNWHYNDPASGTRVAVYEPTYSPRGVLQSEDLVVDAQKTVSSFAGGTRQTVVSGITYDAKGQKMQLRHGNGTTTRYEYDPLTFRLKNIRTIPAIIGAGALLQDLSYIYDPVGNITEIQDNAYKPVFFNGARVLPQNTYTYDVLYRLIAATGREQANLGAPAQKDSAWRPQSFAISDTTLQGYEQHYEYDQVGNILKMRHIADTGAWTRNYQYDLDSNRLLATQMGSALAYNPYVGIATLDDKYEYDTHGNITKIGNGLENRMKWDYRDTVQQYDLMGGGKAYYQYSSETERSRKYIEKGNITEERLYLGGLERYRRWRNSTLEEEIETLHVFEGEQRILMVDNVLQTNNPSHIEGAKYRYQYSNHLGSSSLELNETAQIISYEEYHPYGTTAYHAKNATIKATAKRYRYTGMERDEESGFSYHSARFYLPWLGRWLSADPIGNLINISLKKNSTKKAPDEEQKIHLDEILNLYQYCSSKITTLNDTNGCQANEASLLQQIQQSSESLGQTLATHHAFTRGTAEAVIAEAQGARFLEAGTGREFNHLESLRQGTQAIINRREEILRAIQQLRGINPDAAQVATRSLTPLLDRTRDSIQLSNGVQEMVQEIRTLSSTGATNLTTRLQGMPLQNGRDVANLASSQTSRMGRELVPSALRETFRTTIDGIRQLPVTLSQLRERGREIMGSVAAAYSALRNSPAMIRAGAALGSAIEFLGAFGSRLTTPLIIIVPKGGFQQFYMGASPEEA